MPFQKGHKPPKKGEKMGDLKPAIDAIYDREEPVDLERQAWQSIHNQVIMLKDGPEKTRLTCYDFYMYGLKKGWAA